MSSPVSSECVNHKVLTYSVIFTIIFTVVALGVGLLTSSQVILFDGIFNLVGVALTYLSIISMKFIKKKDSWNYPFGKETFEPFIVITQYCIILFVCMSNITTAVQVILEGGRAINISSGILYGMFAAIYNLLVFGYLKFLTRVHFTAIAEVEIAQWKFGTLLSGTILLGFSLAWLLERTPLVAYQNFIDPVLTIIITIAFIKTAILSITKCVKELLLATPEKEITVTIMEKIDLIKGNYDYLDRVLRLGKVGGKIILEIDYVIEQGSDLDSISKQDELRDQVTYALAEIPYEKWININFIGDIKWADHMSM